MFWRHTSPSFDPHHPEMVMVPAGPFVMGTDPGEIRRLSRSARGDRVEWYAREQPAHTVTLPDYRIGRYPVTVGEFRAFIEAGGYQERAWWSEVGWAWRTRHRVSGPEYWGERRWSGRDDYPIVGVSWYTAQAYCAWLQSVTGLPYRLPSEAEWEKAARGEDGRRYPWGDHWSARHCNVARQTTETWSDRRLAANGLTPVGQYSPKGDSPYGCADMAGNIWEWCDSPLRRYPFDEQPSPALPDAQERQVVRGGSWYHGLEDARCATRYCYYPGGHDNVVGFRLVL